MENTTEIGMNRTGMQMSPVDSKKMLEVTDMTHPSSQGDGIAEVRKRYVKGQRTGAVRRDSRVESLPAQRWDGHDEEARLSTGRHQLQVRVWDEGGDWVGAWSESLVTVQ